MTETTRRCESTAARMVYVALELGARTWKVAVTTDRRDPVRHYTVAAGDVGSARAKVDKARAQWGVLPETPVVSCYEAGRDGFWLHRCLAAQGVRNVVVDATSIEHDRRAKPVKTDRVDAERLVELLGAWAEGRKRLRVVRVPTVAEEDARQAARELATVKAARTAVRNRITGLLVAQGVRLRLTGESREAVGTLRTWDGAALPPGLRGRLERELQELEALTERIAALERARGQAIAAAATPATIQMARLKRLKGLGDNSVAVFVYEFFAWRAFQNGRQVGALAGLTPTPYHSGTRQRDQGISKAGNWRVRAMAIEIAWGWLRFQPQSGLARWYQARFGSGSARLRRIGIVALARKLLIALWQYLETGLVPDGAVVKDAA